MSSNPIRSTLGIFLALVLLSSLVPASYGDSGLEFTGQGSTSRPRRGKNGTPLNTGTPAANQTARQDLPDLPRSDPRDSQPVPVDRAGGDPPSTSPQVSSPDQQSNAGGQSQARRKPLPFDRPPAGSIESAQSDQARRDSRYESAQAGGSGSRRQTNDPPGNSRRSTNSRPSIQPPPPSDSGSDPDERGRSDKPVLRRPTDSRSQSDDGRGSNIPRSQPGIEPAEPDSQPPDDKDEVLRLGATLVNIPLLVSDRSGRYIPQLSARDFLLYEDGVQQEVAFFGSEQVPFNVVLLLDMSPSVQGSADDIHDAAIEFVHQLRRDDRVMVVSFDRRVHFLSDFTNDRRQLESAINSTQTGSGTSVYDAVYEVIERLRVVDGRKALILFSDGEDTTSSRASYDDAIDSVTESDVLVYGLRYPGGNGNIRIDPWPRNRIPQIPFPFPFPWPWPRSRRRGPFTNLAPATTLQLKMAATSSPQNWPRRRRADFMTDVTTAGGGPVYDAERISDLSRLASRIAEELRHVYVVSYYPTNPLSNGGFRSIRVRVKSRDDLAVRHRKGYNARDVNKKT